MSETSLYIVGHGPEESSQNLLPEHLSSGSDVSVILIQDGVAHQSVPARHVYVLSDDALSRNVNSSFPTVSYEGMLKMIFEADHVIVL